MTPRDDPARDAWLSQALRHAPDADAAPPADVSEAILRAARQAVKPTGNAPRPTHPLLELWNWLARPPVAAAFATLMVATLIGVMWWDKPLDETLSRPAEMPAPAEVGSTATAPPPTPAPARTPATTPAPAPAPATAGPATQDNSVTAGRAADDNARATSPRPAQTAAAPKREREREAARAMAESSARVADAAKPAAAPAPAPAPARQPAVATAPAPAPAPAPAREPPQDRVMAKSAAPMREEADAVSASGALGRAAPAASLALRRPDPTASVLPVIEQPDHWAWRRNTGLQPMTPALQAWLAQLDRAAQWRSATGEPAPAGDATVLHLWHDGALRGTVALGADRVWFTPATGPAMTSTLPPTAAAALRTALIDATP